MIDELIIPAALVADLEREARRHAPLEACGLLAGRNGRVEQFYPLTNADAAAEHFSMRPEEQFAAIKAMRGLGLRLLAIWHSHPATPARMSEEDLRLAYTPDALYAIFSLAVPPEQALRAFAVEDGRPREVPVRIETAP